MNQFDKAGAEEAILRLHRAWLKYEVGGDPDGVISLCSEHVVFQPPIGSRISGRAAARSCLAENLGGIVSIDCSEVAIRVSEDLAVKTARFLTRIQGVAEPVTGSHLWVLEPSWQVVFVTWSLDTMPAGS